MTLLPGEQEKHKYMQALVALQTAYRKLRNAYTNEKQRMAKISSAAHLQSLTV